MKRGKNKKVGNKFFRQKKAQGVFGMSFGMIFSIILIIFFIAVAFIAIKSFLGTKTCAQIGIFRENFQTEITKTWKGDNANFKFPGNLPSKIKFVCFGDLDKDVTATGASGNMGRELGVYQGYIANMFLYPTESACDMVTHEIEHLEIDKLISENGNPYCIPVDSGKINIQIKKGFNERLVSIEAVN